MQINYCKMGIRVKEICRDKGISMNMLADKLGITPVSLSQCLAGGNPSLKRLLEFADILGVSLNELYEQPQKTIQGCVFIGNQAYVIRSKADLEQLLNTI